MEIRLLEGADAETYLTLRLRALRENPEAFGSTYEERAQRPLSDTADQLRPAIEPPQRFTLGAYVEDVLAGCVTFRRMAGVKEQHKGVITAMFVAPEQRGRRLGRALMEAAIVRARALPGLEQILLSVVTTNDAARTLYLSLGFAPYGLERHALKQNGRYYDEHLMVLFLGTAEGPRKSPYQGRAKA